MAPAHVVRNVVTANNWIHRIFIFKISIVILVAVKWTIMHSIRFYCRHKIAIIISCHGNIVNVRASRHQARAAVDGPCFQVSAHHKFSARMKTATTRFFPVLHIFISSIIIFFLFRSFGVIHRQGWCQRHRLILQNMERKKIVSSSRSKHFPGRVSQNLIFQRADIIYWQRERHDSEQDKVARNWTLWRLHNLFIRFNVRSQIV